MTKLPLDLYKELAMMWNNQHMSMGQIAAIKGMTRNMISGHISRARGHDFNFEQRTAGRLKAKLTKQAIPLVGIMDHNNDQCRAVVWQGNKYLYCSSLRKEGASYCELHSIGMTANSGRTKL